MITAIRTANAGLLIETDELYLAVDALSDDPEGLYRNTTPETMRLISSAGEGEKPLYMLFTHEHGDHFSADITSELLNKGNMFETSIAGNAAVCSALKAAGLDERRIFCIDGMKQLKLPGSRMIITFLKSMHEGEQYKDVANYSILLENDGICIVITGDAAPTDDYFTDLSEAAPRIDVLFAPFPYVGLTMNRKRMGKHLCPKKIYAFHDPDPASDPQGWGSSARRIDAEAKDDLAKAIFMEMGVKYELT